MGASLSGSRLAAEQGGAAGDGAGQDWAALARELAAEFGRTVVERERAGRAPQEEIRRLKESGLVNLLIPAELGGGGGSLADAAQAVFELAKVDGSLAFLLFFHFNSAAGPRQLDRERQGASFEQRSARERWFWGNVIGPFHISATPREGGGFVLAGSKHMCSGASVADVIKVTAARTDRDELVHLVIPAGRAGIRIHQDWDHLGLRRSETQTVSLDGVLVEADEVLPASAAAGQNFAPFIQGGRLLSAAFYLGSLFGALESARAYMLAVPPNPRPLGGNFELVTQDPFVQLPYAEAWIRAQAGLALLERQLAELAALTAAGTADEAALAELNGRNIAAQHFATEIALETTAKLYEWTGGRSLANKYGLDRYWRDVRAYSVHHPASHTLRALGDGLLNGKPAARPSIFDIRRQQAERQRREG